jgi:hypothetical protein
MSERKILMNPRSLALIAILVSNPAYADDATTVIKDIGSEWQAAYNRGDAGKVADLYVPDAVGARCPAAAGPTWRGYARRPMVCRSVESLAFRYMIWWLTAGI